MQRITLRVISGADRGRVYRELAMPITIGREEGNMVQLNDERISRYHVKIQEDESRLVITDLDSTNGTRVNGHVCSLKILRYGDTISIGRTVLLVGTREQVADWFDANRDLTSNSS
ncbi:MAG: FHA domain-containing protein, partial [Aureliella sp.]